MKLFKNLLSIVLILTLVLMSTTMWVSASESKKEDTESIVLIEQYVEGEFRVSPEFAQKVYQKQQAAENFYNAYIKGDYKMAAKYKAEFEKLTNPVLYEIQKNQLSTQNVTRDSYPSSATALELVQCPQERDYWCGPAAAQSILTGFGINISQTVLAGTDYCKTEQEGNTPWYMANGNSYIQFPMYNALTKVLEDEYWAGNLDSVYGYIPSPLGNAGANPLSVEQCKAYIMSTTSAFGHGYGVAANGTSKANDEDYQLPGYPNRNIGHWIVCYGYFNNAAQVVIADPAKSPAVSWAGSIDAYYSVDINVFRNFISPKGIIW